MKLWANIMTNVNQAEPQAQTGFNLKNYLPLLSTVYAEGENQPPKAQIEIISSILNRAESGKKEYGADTGSLMNVLKTGYKSAQHNSPKYQEAISQQFKNPIDEHAFIQILQSFSGIMNGTIPRTKSTFILTDKDIADVKSKKLMDMNKLEQTAKYGDFSFFKYKDFSKNQQTKKVPGKGKTPRSK